MDVANTYVSSSSQHNTVFQDMKPCPKRIKLAVTLWELVPVTKLFHFANWLDTQGPFDYQPTTNEILLTYFATILFQINQLSEEFSVKSNESIRQKEEITHLLAQVRHSFLDSRLWLWSTLESEVTLLH